MTDRPTAKQPWMTGLPLTRRDLGILAGASILAACKKEESATSPAETMTDTGPPASSTPASATSSARSSAAAESPAIASAATVAVATADVHIHLFNANFLPLAGIFAKWVDDPIARTVARLLLKKVNDCSNAASLAAAGVDPLREIETVPPDDLIDRLYDEIGSKDVIEGLSSASPATKARLSSASAPQQEAIAREEFKSMFDKTAEGAREVFPEKGGFVQWVMLMTWCERKIWSAVRHAYPDVELFVAHMMDMENYYTPSRPKYAWPGEQLRRMQKLMDDADGRLLTFVAFDPKRENWKDILDEALKYGCAGVKFYPPNGYGPCDPTTKAIDPRTADFFRYCITEGLPVFTHTTAHGMESRTGYGQHYANPALWRYVLQKREFRELRLCFAHAGGEDGWFPSDDERAASDARPSFSTDVVKLCKDYPNVYCEVAYLSPILKTKGQERFRRALQRIIDQRGDYPFASKVMYGSDWHMIHKIRDHRAYLPSFRKAFAAPEWDDFRADFFLGNALRWLNLPGYLERMRTRYPEVLSVAAVEHLESLMTRSAG